MEIVIAVLVGTLFGLGVYCFMRRSIVKLVIGVILISQGANLLVFMSGGLAAGRPAIIKASETVPDGVFGDPLPQAMVLTAIVIGFGLVVFLLSLLYRAHEAVGSDDINAFDKTDT